MRLALSLSLLLTAAACSGPAAAGNAPQAPSPAPAGSAQGAGVASAAADTTPPTGAAAPAPADRPAPLRIPRQVGSLVLAQRQDFEQPGAGSRFRYVMPDSLYADVFVYPGPDLGANCDVECGEGVLEQEAARFQDLELPETVRAGTVESFDLLTHDTLAPLPGAPWRIGRHIGLTLRYPDRPAEYRSEFWLWYLPFYRVKVRATFVDTPARSQALEDFLQALLPALVPESPEG